MKSKYKSSKSVAKNQTVPIAANDPRLAWNKAGQTKARQGAEIEIIGLNNKSLITGGTGTGNPTGSTFVAASQEFKSVIVPASNNEPPKTYPGGSGPFVITPIAPTDVVSTWSGEDLVVSFNWDYKDQYSATVSQFILEITADGVTRRTPTNTFTPNKTQTAQTVTLTKSLNRITFGLFRTGITSICVLAADPLNNISTTTCAATVPTYVLDLPVPVITTTAISNGYSVSYTTPTQSSYDAIDIWEIEDAGSTAPTIIYSPGTTTPTNYKRSYFNNMNPANVITQNYNKRWVIARFSSSGGTYTAFCAAQATTPTSPVSVDNTPPNEVDSVTGVWSGDNINISYTLPSTDPGTRVQIELTAPNDLVGFFYRFPSGSGTSQTAQITKKDLFDQFGEHYSSFAGILRSIDASDNRTSGVSFTVAQRTNAMSSVTPTFTLTPLTNGYSVFATNYATTTGISYMEVYAKHTQWTGDPENDDDVVYSGANPAVVIDTDYTTVYVKIHYYDDFGNTSLYSIEDTVVPLGPGDITSFETPITFGTNGVIYAGGDYDSGHRTIFKTSGIFAYDASSTSPSTGLTTQIVSDASSGTPTFITTRAQIADWNITDTKIENDLSGTPSKYTGLSATGTYSFWAGSDVSGGDSSSNFTVTPAGEVTAREITIIGNGGTDPLISAGGLFTVNNDGSFTATSAEITGKITASSGEFTGNVKLNGGSLYALGTGGTVSSGRRTIFNGSGIAAFNENGGYAEMLTTPLADGSVFATTAANIGGWKVNASEIAKTSIAGGGNITLNSTSGYISVSNTNVSSYTAGINATTTSSTSNAFWAGTGGPLSTSNGFRVTLGGQLYATGAAITGGTITSTGSLGTVTMDGVNDLISITADAQSTYLFGRNSNTYLTSGFPFGGTVGSPTYSSLTNLTANPYFTAGSGFKDYWNNTTKGIGIFTGAWDYFAGGSSTPFITATTTGLQLSASPSLGLLLDAGTAATGDKLNPAVSTSEPSMLFYTSKQKVTDGKPYSPSTAYGAWAAFTSSKITLAATSTTLVRVDGTEGAPRIDLKATSDIWQSLTSTGIRIQSTSTVYQEFSSTSIVLASGNTSNTTSDLSAYGGGSKITINGTKVSITGIPRASTFDMDDYRVGILGDGNYRNLSALGYPPRQRTVIEDPDTGEAQLGFGIYYLDLTKINGTGPGSNMGVQGDIAVVF